MKDKLRELYSNIKLEIVGQELLVRDLIIALLTGGHVLIEGMPGLAKTRTSLSLAKSIEAIFKRIQFTPDLLPSDLIGTDIYVESEGKFSFQEGPLFANIILADEINRAPAKVQSALLEAMAEKQITVGQKTYKLSELFMVIATQNPIDQSGTYSLPEAQLDRFLFYVNISYPSKEEELQLLDMIEKEDKSPATLNKIFNPNEILQMRKEVRDIYLDAKLKQYIVDLVCSTRNITAYDESLAKYVKYGASPRATISLMEASKALAYLEGKDHVSPIHIQTLAPNILKHRLILTYHADAEEISAEYIVNKLLELVVV